MSKIVLSFSQTRLRGSDFSFGIYLATIYHYISFASLYIIDG